MIGEAALALLAGEADRGARAHAFMVLGTIHHRQGRARQARAAFQEALALFVALNREGDARRVRQELALLALDSGDMAEARRCLEGSRSSASPRWSVRGATRREGAIPSPHPC